MKQSEMRRVDIFHTNSSVCLYSRTWGEWKGANSDESDCSSLVSSYFQLSRQLEAGELELAVFSDSVVDTSKTPRKRYDSSKSNFTFMNSVSSSLSRKLIEPTSSLKLIVKSNGKLTIAVFFDQFALNEEAQIFATKSLEEFHSLFSQQISNYTSLFQEMEKNPEHNYDRRAVLQDFEPFAASLDKIYNEI